MPMRSPPEPGSTRAVRPGLVAPLPAGSRSLPWAPLRGELGDPTSDRVIEVLIVAHERGGRIVLELLRDLAEGTTEDLRTEEEIATASLEQRINARAVFVLPWVVLVALTAS